MRPYFRRGVSRRATTAGLLAMLLITATGYGRAATAASVAARTATHECRFWVCAAEAIPAYVINDHLVRLPNSIENLSRSNVNGWGVAYYTLGSGEPTVLRGRPAAWQDTGFDSAVAEAAGRSPQIAVSHIRACSSGLCDIPDPHPFERAKHGTHWLMGHNGTISKQVLLDLIRPDYLEANPPQYGSNYPEWIDTDLYFIYMLQTIEDHDWQVKPAIGEVIERLCDAIPGDGEKLNFFLTDGTTVWAYRQGNTLYCMNDPGKPSGRHRGAGPHPATAGIPYSAVASQYPDAMQGAWRELADGDLVTLTPSGAPVIEAAETYFP